MIKFIDSLIAWLTNPGAKAAELAAAIRSAGSLWSSTETQSKLDEKITSIQAGENVTINWLDPLSPIINAQGTGFGDVAGPASSVSGNVAVFSDTSGKVIEDSGVALPVSFGDVTGPASSTDGNLASFDGVGGKTIADSTIALTDVQAAVEKAGFLTVTGAVDLDAIAADGVTGPASSVADRIAVFSGTTGKLIADGGKTVAELQPLDTDLTAIAALTSAANKLPYATGAGTWAMTDFSAFGRTLVDDADAATARTTLGVVIGTDVQAYDVDTAKTDVAQQFTKPQRGSSTTLTSGTTITQDLADGNNWDLTLGHNATLANPTNQSSYVKLTGGIDCVQDGTGGRTLAFGSNWYPIGAATAPAAPTGANAKFRIDFKVVSSTRIDFKLSSVGV